MAERQDFPFSPGDLGILSTEEYNPIEVGENFLSSDPNDIKLATKVKTKKKDDEEEEEDIDKEEEIADKKVDDPKKGKKPIKEVVSKPKEVSPDDVFGSMTESDEDPDEDEGTEVKTPVIKKDGAQQQPQPEEGEDIEEEANVYSTIAQELVNHGIFKLEEDEESIELETPQELLERFQFEARKEANIVIEKFLGRFGDDYADMFQNVFVRGVAPADYLSRYTKIQNVASVDITDEANQERIVRELYRSEGRSAEYIEKRITQLKNYGDLSDEATEGQRVLIEKEKAANEESARMKQMELQRKQEIRTEYLGNVGKILNNKIKDREFDGIPVDKRFAEQIMDYMTKEKYQTKGNQLLTEFDRDILELDRPANHEMKVKVAMIMQLLKEDPTLSKLAKKAVSKESGELFKGLKRTAIKSGTAKGKESKETEDKRQPESWFPQQRV